MYKIGHSVGYQINKTFQLLQGAPPDPIIRLAPQTSNSPLSRILDDAPLGHTRLRDYYSESKADREYFCVSSPVSPRSSPVSGCCLSVRRS